MRIVRYSEGEAVHYGVLEGDPTSPNCAVVRLEGDPFADGVAASAERVRLDKVRLLSPLPPHRKVVAIGRNYAAHAAELGNEVPSEPMVFLKPSSAVVGQGDDIVYPAQSENLHFEGELVAVIGRTCRHVRAGDAASVILGFTVGNDVTARDLQRKDVQFTRGKGFDTFCPVGPWIDTELDVTDVAVQTYLNGELKQHGRTSELIFDIPTLVEFVTSVMTLNPGDVIMTGTPEGVGPMQVGDTVTIEVEGLGRLENHVVAGTNIDKRINLR